MEYLYAFSLQGKTLYFSGIIPSDKVDDVERIANNVLNTNTLEEYIQELIETVFCELKIALSYCPVEYVFRVKKKGRLPD